MDLKTRVQNILLTPKTEWPAIEAEPTPTGSIVTGYVMPLAAIGAVAGFIGGSLVGVTLPFLGRYRVPITSGLMGAVLTFCFAIVGVFILAFIINALAPTFGAQQDSSKAFKVAVYSYTPAWIAGALQILPALGVLGIIAALYGLYLLYLGLPALMKAPQDKAVGYTAVVVVCAIVLSFVVTAIGGMVVGRAAIGAGLGAGGIGGLGAGSTPAESTFAADSPLGKLEALGKKLEESGAKMEQAQKSGDSAAGAAAAMEGLGAILGGGKRVDPVSIDQLRPLVPDQFAGMARQSIDTARNGIGGIMVTKAEASYGDGAGHSARLEITDSGGATGLLGFAAWAQMQGERDNAQFSEKTERVGDRLVHQRISKTGGQHEFTVIIGDRFIVEAKGDGIEFNALKSAVSSLELGKLDAMKGVGVSK